jgi:hypothetical protein
MHWNRKRRAWLLASAMDLAPSGGAFASGDTPTMEEMLAASPNRLTVQEREDLERRAASGESAGQAPEGTYGPSAAPEASVAATDRAQAPAGATTGRASTSAKGEARRATPATLATPATPAAPGVAPAIPVTPAVSSGKVDVPTTEIPADKADSRDGAGARNDVAPRKSEVPADRKRG